MINIMQNVDINAKENDLPQKTARMFEMAMVAMDSHGEGANWYLDSGATNHVTEDISSMKDLHNIENFNVQLARGQFHDVLGKGNVAFTYNEEIKCISRLLCPGSDQQLVVCGEYSLI